MCTKLKTELTHDVCVEASKNKAQPGVYKACKNGKLMGFEHACMPTCTGEEYKGRDSVPGDSFNVCKSERNKPNPNNYLIWCRRGYDTTFNDAMNAVIEIKNTWLEDDDEPLIEDREIFANTFDDSDVHHTKEQNKKNNLADRDRIKKLPLNHVEPEVLIKGHIYHKESEASPLQEALDTYSSSTSSEPASGTKLNLSFDDKEHEITAVERVAGKRLESSKGILQDSGLHLPEENKVGFDWNSVVNTSSLNIKNFREQ